MNRIQPSDRAPRIDWNSSTKRWTDSPPLEFEDSVVVGSMLHKISGFDPETGAKLWTTDVGNKLTKFAKVGEDTVLASSVPSVSSASPDDTRREIALDARTGAVRWEKEVRPWGPSRWVAPDGSLYTSNGRLERIDPKTGQPLWSQDFDVDTDLQVTSDGSLVATRSRGQDSPDVVRVDAESGKVLWSYTPGGWVDSVTASDQGVLVTTVKEGRARYGFLLDPATGRPSARFDVPKHGFAIPPTFGPDGKVYLAEFSQTGMVVKALDASGVVAWSRDEAPGRSSFTFGDRDELYLSTYKTDDQGSTYGCVVRSFGMRDGAVRWSFEPPDAVFPEVRAVQDKTVIAVGDATQGYGQVAYALDRDSGAPLWQFDPKSAIHDVIQGPDGQVVIHAEEDGYRLHVLDAETGEPRWQFNTGDRLYIAPSPDVLRAVDHEGNLFNLSWTPGEPYQGGPPRDPGQSTGSSDFHGTNQLIEGEFAGAPALWIDSNMNRTADGRDYLLVRDRNHNGQLDWDEVATPVTRPELASLDADQDGLVSEAEWAGQGLCLWRDRNGDGRIGRGELSDPGTENGLHTAFDLERSTFEESGSHRFDNGHIKSPLPEDPEIEPPATELPPEAVAGAGAVIQGMAGEWRGDGDRWTGVPEGEGLKGSCEIFGEGHEFAFVKTDGWRLHWDDQEIALSDYNPGEGTYLFGYPDHWERETLHRGGGIQIASRPRGFVVTFVGSDMYRMRDGKLRQTGVGSSFPSTFTRKVKTELPGTDLCSPWRDSFVGEGEFST